LTNITFGPPDPLQIDADAGIIGLDRRSSGMSEGALSSALSASSASTSERCATGPRILSLKHALTLELAGPPGVDRVIEQLREHVARRIFISLRDAEDLGDIAAPIGRTTLRNHQRSDTPNLLQRTTAVGRQVHLIAQFYRAAVETRHTGMAHRYSEGEKPEF